MAYQHHLNKPRRRITLHKVGCGQWQKHVGTKFHKHGEDNSSYLSYEKFHIDDYPTARKVGTEIARKFYYRYHECPFCCGK